MMLVELRSYDLMYNRLEFLKIVNQDGFVNVVCTLVSVWTANFVKHYFCEFWE